MVIINILGISNFSHSQMNWKPGNLFTIFSPCKLEFLNYILVKKLHSFPLSRLICWPWSQVSEEIIQIHQSLCHKLKGSCVVSTLHSFKWKINGSIKLINQFTFWVPIRPYVIGIELIKDCVHFITNSGQIVAPCSNDSMRLLQDPFHLLVEGWPVKPVQGLGYGHKVYASLRSHHFFNFTHWHGWRGVLVTHVGNLGCKFKLLGTRICCYHILVYHS